MSSSIRRLCAGMALACSSLSAQAAVFSPPVPGSDLIGELKYTPARHEDTLIDIAREFSVGQDEIVMANPKVDRWLPGAGAKVLLPRWFILPEAPRKGIVVNIPEMRLYYYTGGAKNEPAQVITYPISIGRMDWRTPLGATKVIQKVKDPVWRPPESIKREHAKDGDFLPDVVPAGPNNPLGQFAMKLGVPGYLIHGTDVNKAFGIGMRVTHGCIRMYPEDVAKLFPLVNVGTPVQLVNQPVKLGWLGDRLYIEVSQPLDEDSVSYHELLSTALGLIEKKTAQRPFALDGVALRQAIEKPSGIPVLISSTSGVAIPVPPGEPAGPITPVHTTEDDQPGQPSKPQPVPQGPLLKSLGDIF
ncbi:L,D-transpeptidase family protein [Methylococcus sp. EFPC2]|nr:L,D-transpeptidase family protein [Methylococcus sp. EFPC2]